MINEINAKKSPVSFQAKPIPQTVIERTVRNLLDTNVKNIDIYCHASADEDTINAAKVFSNWLTSHNKKVSICVQKSETKDLFIKGSKYNLKTDTAPADRTVILDFNSRTRLSSLCKKLIKSTRDENLVIFDHHTREEATFPFNTYIDDTAKSCCGILVRFFEGLGEKIKRDEYKSLFCGMVSDYKKSGLLKVTNNHGIYTIKKTEKLLRDKNSLEVFNKVEEALTVNEKNKILQHLDPLSRLTPDEKRFEKELYKNIRVTANGKMAYVVVQPDDKLWARIGMDTPTSSEILKDFRVKVMEHNFDETFLTPEQKYKLKDVNTVIAFYKKSPDAEDGYSFSIHSASNSALRLIDAVKPFNQGMVGGGHADRAGGRILSAKQKDIENLVSSFISAAYNTNI